MTVRTPREARMPAEIPVASDLRAYVPLVSFLGAILGDDTEVLLHDVRDVNRSIVAIVNGHISGRALGGPATDLVLSILKSNRIGDRDYIANYESFSRDGGTYRSHTYVIRAPDRTMIGLICVNTDIAKILQARELLSNLARVEPLVDERPVTEQLGATPAEVVQNAIDKHIAAIGVDPARMSSGDRQRVVAGLHDDGVFMMKGAVAQIGQTLRVSDPTIYRYISLAKRASHR